MTRLLTRDSAASSSGDASPTTTPISLRWPRPTIETGVAVAVFVGLCVAVLTRSTQLLEPDDLAYRASIVALTHGHITLSSAQYAALSSELGSIAQWVQLPNGSWISEKNPGYPFFAAPFQLLGLLRLTPIFYGALGCIGLYAGGRRWLGRFGGAWAVVLYCASGAALLFAWRASMPTFTDASLIAAGTGALLWTMLAVEASARRRTAVGLLGFLALEGAVSIRYTNAVVLAVALVAVAVALRAARLPWRSFGWWVGSAAVLAALLAAFDAHYYGGVTHTGYSSGEITFAVSALLPNLQHVPAHLVRSMPLLVPALAAVAWIAARAARIRRTAGDAPARRRDAAVAGALAACWAGIFGLYAAYTWTVAIAPNANSTLQVVRFYLPALGAVALLAAWLLAQARLPIAVAGLTAAVCLAAFTYPSLAGGTLGGPGGGRPGAVPGAAHGVGQDGAAPSGAPPGPSAP